MTGCGSTRQVEVQGVQGRGALQVNLLPNSDIRDLSGRPLYSGLNAQYHAEPAYVETEAAPLPLRQPEVMTADFDGDGRQEIIMTGSGSDHRGKLKVIELDNSGAVQVRRPSLDLRYFEPTVIDIDQNGTDELLLFRGSQIQAVRIDSNGQPTIVADSTYYADGYYGFNVPDQTSFADMNGDGRIDFVRMLSNGGSGQTHVGVATGDGTGRFSVSTVITSPGFDIPFRVFARTVMKDARGQIHGNKRSSASWADEGGVGDYKVPPAPLLLARENVAKGFAVTRVDLRSTEICLS